MVALCDIATHLSRLEISGPGAAHLPLDNGAALRIMGIMGRAVQAAQRLALCRFSSVMVDVIGRQ